MIQQNSESTTMEAKRSLTCTPNTSMCWAKRTTHVLTNIRNAHCYNRQHSVMKGDWQTQALLNVQMTPKITL